MYWYKCECGDTYCGSSKRSLHIRAEEHLTGKNGATAVTDHIRSCSQGANGEIKIHDRGRDTVDTRLREAIHIAEKQPTLNRMDELGRWISGLP